MKKSLMVALAVILALIVGATGVFAAGDGCFTDADGDGICDNRGTNEGAGKGDRNGNGCGGGSYIDVDGDGVCDNRGTGTGGGGHHGNGNGCR